MPLDIQEMLEGIEERRSDVMKARRELQHATEQLQDYEQYAVEALANGGYFGFLKLDTYRMRVAINTRKK